MQPIHLYNSIAIFPTIACAGIIAFYIYVECFTSSFAHILYTALLQTVATSDFLLVRNMINASYNCWRELAAHLGSSADLIWNIQCRTGGGDLNCFVKAVEGWADRKEGTGSRPRNWKTVLEVFRRLCVGSDEQSSKLASIESKLINGIKLY